MKKLVFVMLSIALSSAAFAQDQKATATTEKADKNAGIFKFKEETHDFGEVKEGPAAECDFVFKNTGKSPIVISNAHGTCGCTIPSWPKEPIMPGKSGTIHVSYNTSGRVGPIVKDVVITSNAQQSPMMLHIKGTVVKEAPVAAVKQ